MKPSRSRIKNAIDKAQKRKAGKPKQSKYEAKRFAPAENPYLPEDYKARLEASTKDQNDG